MAGAPLRLTVPPDAEGSRLDQFLAAAIPGRTRSALRRCIVEGLVAVDGRAAGKPGMALRPGMRVEVALPEPPPDAPGPEAIPVRVVHEDEHLAVIDKPAGLVVHPGHGRRTGTLVNALLGLGVPLAAAGGTERPGIVHRLDRETSGLLVVAKTDAAHRALVAMFARREIRKIYHALVWGHPDPGDGTVERAIGRSRSDPTRMSVGAPRGRPATTIFRTIERIPGFALLEIHLVTGRTHQIRVHLASLHHPVVGDARYGGTPWKTLRDPAAKEAVRSLHRLALHASELALRHPVTGEPLRFQAPIPAEFLALLDRLRGVA